MSRLLILAAGLHLATCNAPSGGSGPAGSSRAPSPDGAAAKAAPPPGRAPLEGGDDDAQPGALRCDPPLPSVGSAWTEEIAVVVEEAAVGACQAQPQSGKRTEALTKEVLAMDGGVVTKLRLKALADRSPGTFLLAVDPAGSEPRVTDERGDPVKVLARLDARARSPELGAPSLRALLAGARLRPGERAEVLSNVVPRIAGAVTGLDDGTRGVAVVDYEGTAPRPFGDAETFRVHLTATRADAGMCHRWETHESSDGQLVLRARDHALVELTLRGTVETTEALCPEGAKAPGAPKGPKTCTRGTVSRRISVPCVAASAPD